VTSDDMKWCMTRTEVKTAVSQYKKAVSKTRSSHKWNVATCGQFSNM